MKRLTIPDEKIPGGIRQALIDTREVRKDAMTLYWRLKSYEDTGLEPEEITAMTSWIPAYEQLPTRHGHYLVKVRHHRWISDFDKDYVAEAGQDAAEQVLQSAT